MREHKLTPTRGRSTIRWQVRADLLGASIREVEVERARIARGGRGRRLLAGGASAFWGLELPTSASPLTSLLGVLITKLGTAIACGVVFRVSRTTWGPRWFLYGVVWFVMFGLSEVGAAVSGRTTAIEAGLGVLSEAIYAPLAAFTTQSVLGRGTAD